MTKFVSVLLISASILNAGYDMAFAKASKEIKIEKPTSVKVTYTMHDMLKKDFQTSMETALKKSGIKTEDKAGIKIEIVPVRFEAIGKYQKDDKIVPEGLVSWTPPQEANQVKNASNTNLQGSAKKTFLDGVAQPGSQGSYSTVAQGVGNMVTVGLINVTLGSIGYGVDYLWTTSDKYMMVTDVLIDGERTRVFALVKDGSTIKPSEAILELSRLTTEKTLSMLGKQQ